jgi:hypothetical protein
MEIQSYVKTVDGTSNILTFTKYNLGINCTNQNDRNLSAIIEDA